MAAGAAGGGGAAPAPPAPVLATPDAIANAERGAALAHLNKKGVRYPGKFDQLVDLQEPLRSQRLTALYASRPLAHATVVDMLATAAPDNFKLIQTTGDHRLAVVYATRTSRSARGVCTSGSRLTCRGASRRHHSSRAAAACAAS